MSHLSPFDLVVTDTFPLGYRFWYKSVQGKWIWARIWGAGHFNSLSWQTLMMVSKMGGIGNFWERNSRWIHDGLWGKTVFRMCGWKHEHIYSTFLSQVDVYFSQVRETWGQPHPVLVSTNLISKQEVPCYVPLHLLLFLLEYLLNWECFVLFFYSKLVVFINIKFYPSYIWIYKLFEILLFPTDWSQTVVC